MNEQQDRLLTYKVYSESGQYVLCLIPERLERQVRQSECMKMAEKFFGAPPKDLVRVSSK